jgi:hypothetical protein
MTPARHRAELTGQIAALLARALPGLAEETAAEAVSQATKNIPGCTKLLEHLQQHPDTLSSGSSRSPLPVIRLAHALSAAGVEGVVLPGCPPPALRCLRRPRPGQHARSGRPGMQPLLPARPCPA